MIDVQNATIIIKIIVGTPPGAVLVNAVVLIPSKAGAMISANGKKSYILYANMFAIKVEIK